MTPTVRDMSRDELTDLLSKHGSRDAVAQHLGVSRSAVRDAYQQAGIGNTQRPRPAAIKGGPRLTREGLAAALLPPNNCRVKPFLEQIDPDDREIVEEALGYDRQDLSASGLRQWLIDSGFDERLVPGVDAINAHRTGTRPCRCKG